MTKTFSLENFNENVDLILNCNIERLISRSNTIEAIEYQSNKKIGKFLVNKNQKVILAAGGISNAHILLKSDPKTLNKNGLVGRNLMEHPHGFVGHVVLDKIMLLILMFQILANCVSMRKVYVYQLKVYMITKFEK